MYPCNLAQGEVRSSTSSSKIDESPVTCGEPARRTDNICTYRNTRARDGVRDVESNGKLRSSVRFDLRVSFDVRDLGSGGVRDSKSKGSNEMRDLGSRESMGSNDVRDSGSKESRGLNVVRDSGPGESRFEESRVAEKSVQINSTPSFQHWRMVC